MQLDLHNNHNYDVDFIIPDCKESIGTKKAFLERHPIQPLGTNGKQMPFNPSKLYYRALPNGEKILRKWISYSSILNKIFCASCMVFSDKTSNVSPFVNGYTIKAKHVYKAAEEHENSNTHRHAISAALQCSMSKDIGSLIDRDLTFKRMKEIEQRRLVLKRLIDIIIFIGRQGLPFRGKEEGAHSLNKKGNHGNFLELVLLLADYDSVLRVHLDQCVLKSDKNKQNRGRGSLITFMSKSIVNKLIIIIGNSLQNIILNEIKESSIISVMVDSTQDVAVMDQLAIVVRYVIEGNIFERLLKLVVVKDSSGKALYDLLKQNFEKCGISMTQIVGCSFDGAANMKGAYNRLKAHISKDNPDLIYTHCMAHVLNLIIADSSEDCSISENLYGLVEETAVFLSNSHKRMNIWKEQTGKIYFISYIYILSK